MCRMDALRLCLTEKRLEKLETRLPRAAGCTYRTEKVAQLGHPANLFVVVRGPSIRRLEGVDAWMCSARHLTMISAWRPTCLQRSPLTLTVSSREVCRVLAPPSAPQTLCQPHAKPRAHTRTQRPLGLDCICGRRRVRRDARNAHRTQVRIVVYTTHYQDATHHTSLSHSLYPISARIFATPATGTFATRTDTDARSQPRTRHAVTVE